MSAPRILTTEETRGWLADSAGLLLDVRLASEFERVHIGGAENNCVFEIAFIERLRERAPDLATPICVYGAGADSHESRFAVEKMLRAGYANICDYRDGLAAWRETEGPLNETLSDTRTLSPDFEGERALDASQSSIEWTGRNLGTRHWGTLGVDKAVSYTHLTLPTTPYV